MVNSGRHKYAPRGHVVFDAFVMPTFRALAARARLEPQKCVFKKANRTKQLTETFMLVLFRAVTKSTVRLH
jgi:hypothetical protein